MKGCEGGRRGGGPGGKEAITWKPRPDQPSIQHHLKKPHWMPELVLSVSPFPSQTTSQITWSPRETCCLYLRWAPPSLIPIPAPSTRKQAVPSFYKPNPMPQAVCSADKESSICSPMEFLCKVPWREATLSGNGHPLPPSLGLATSEAAAGQTTKETPPQNQPPLQTSELTR